MAPAAAVRVRKVSVVKGEGLGNRIGWEGVSGNQGIGEWRSGNLVIRDI